VAGLGASSAAGGSGERCAGIGGGGVLGLTPQGGPLDALLAPFQGLLSGFAGKRGVGASAAAGDGGGSVNAEATTGGAAVGVAGPASSGRVGPLRRLGRAVGNRVLAVTGAVGRPLAGLVRDRVSNRAKGAVAEKLGVF